MDHVPNNNACFHVDFWCIDVLRNNLSYNSLSILCFGFAPIPTNEYSPAVVNHTSETKREDAVELHMAPCPTVAYSRAVFPTKSANSSCCVTPTHEQLNSPT